MTPSQPSQSPQEKAIPQPCKHPRVQIVSRDEESEYVECKECGEVFESSELKDMAIEEKNDPDEEASNDTSLSLQHYHNSFSVPDLDHKIFSRINPKFLPGEDHGCCAVFGNHGRSGQSFPGRSLVRTVKHGVYLPVYFLPRETEPAPSLPK